MKRGIIKSDTQRAPWPRISDATRREIDYLLGRLDARSGAK
jgi:hypothetical protein